MADHVRPFELRERGLGDGIERFAGFDPVIEDRPAVEEDQAGSAITSDDRHAVVEAQQIER